MQYIIFLLVQDVLEFHQVFEKKNIKYFEKNVSIKVFFFREFDKKYQNITIKG